jgi:hypothetical protein
LHGETGLEIQRNLVGFRVFFFFSAILALTSSALAGSGQLTSNPSALNLGSVQVGSSLTQPLTLTNVGS